MTLLYVASSGGVLYFPPLEVNSFDESLLNDDDLVLSLSLQNGSVKNLRTGEKFDSFADAETAYGLGIAHYAK